MACCMIVQIERNIEDLEDHDRRHDHERISRESSLDHNQCCAIKTMATCGC